jgi:hypothetical protein
VRESDPADLGEHDRVCERGVLAGGQLETATGAFVERDAGVAVVR